MITITNRKDKIVVDDKYLKKDKKNYMFVGVNRYWEIAIVFVYGRKGFRKTITKIEKSLGSADDSEGDTLKEYLNEIISKNEIVLSDEDYKEVVRLINNLKTKDNHRKAVIIESYSKLIAYECYMNYIMYELDEVSIEDIFRDVCCCCNYDYEKNKYKNEILDSANEILKREYKVNLGYVFDGGSKNE